jgi:hypothetical protein
LEPAFFNSQKERGKTMAHYPTEYDALEHRTLAFARGDDEEQQKSEVQEHCKKNSRDLPPFAEVFTDWRKLTEELKSGDVLVVARFGAISRKWQELQGNLRSLFGCGIIVEPVNDDYREPLDHYREVEPYMEKVERYFGGLGELCQKMLKEEDTKREQKSD